MDRVRGLLTFQPPVTYGQFCLTIAGVSTIVLPLVGGVAVVFGAGAALVAALPVPFVFFAATLGFAVRGMHHRGVATSLLLGAGYAVLLGTTGLAGLTLAQGWPILAVQGLLVVVAGFLGFASPRLHGRDRLARADWRRRQRRS